MANRMESLSANCINRVSVPCVPVRERAPVALRGAAQLRAAQGSYMLLGPSDLWADIVF